MYSMSCGSSSSALPPLTSTGIPSTKRGAAGRTRRTLGLPADGDPTAGPGVTITPGPARPQLIGVVAVPSWLHPHSLAPAGARGGVAPSAWLGLRWVHAKTNPATMVRHAGHALGTSHGTPLC